MDAGPRIKAGGLIRFFTDRSRGFYLKFYGMLSAPSLCEMRRIKFLNKTRTLTHAVLQSLTGQFY